MIESQVEWGPLDILIIDSPPGKDHTGWWLWQKGSNGAPGYERMIFEVELKMIHSQVIIVISKLCYFVGVFKISFSVQQHVLFSCSHLLNIEDATGSQFPPRNWWRAAVYRSNFVSGWLRFGRNSQLEGLELLVSRQDDEMIPRSPRPTPSAWPMWTKGCSSSPRCSGAIWSMSCGFICVDMFMWVKMIVLNRGVRVYCLNYIFWMFCNAGESYVCNYYPCETWVWWVHATPTHVYYIIIRISYIYLYVDNWCAHVGFWYAIFSRVFSVWGLFSESHPPEMLRR